MASKSKSGNSNVLQTAIAKEGFQETAYLLIRIASSFSNESREHTSSARWFLFKFYSFVGIGRKQRFSQVQRVLSIAVSVTPYDNRYVAVLVTAR
ncbi:MAG TPA: hypothetical protein VFA77_16755 [Candidatus Eisenbacteria bacterium]|jgi:hypothetical protein|nr:hypothetical protein [Candidatus Eisenbacteria bacterium]